MHGRWDASGRTPSGRTPAGRTPETAAAAYGGGAPAGVRIGDAERERAVSELGEHFAVGRLTREELDERLELAWQAKTAGQLVPLFADLPGRSPAVRPTQATTLGRGPFGFPWPVLAIVAIVLTIATHVPFILFFFVGWLVLGRVLHGHSHRPYAIRQ